MLCFIFCSADVAALVCLVTAGPVTRLRVMIVFGWGNYNGCARTRHSHSTSLVSNRGCRVWFLLSLTVAWALRPNPLAWPYHACCLVWCGAATEKVVVTTT